MNELTGLSTSLFRRRVVFCGEGRKRCLFPVAVPSSCVLGLNSLLMKCSAVALQPCRRTGIGMLGPWKAGHGVETQLPHQAGPAWKDSTAITVLQQS